MVCRVGMRRLVTLSQGAGPFDIWVDSVNGSDSNSGLSRNVPKQTIAAAQALMSASRKRIGLAKGSHWREMLTISMADAVVGSYGGSGARPILNAKDIIVNADLAKTAARTNVYETATINFIMGGVAAAWVNVFENGLFLRFVSDVATVDSTPGSYTVLSMTTGGGVPASAKIYIHATSSENPISNGKTYEFSNRRAGLYATGARTRITGIEARGASSNSGAFVLDSGDAGGFLVDDCLARDCNDHALFCTSGSRIRNSTFINGYWGTAGPNLVVFYENVGVGGDFWSENNIYQQDKAVPGAGVMTAILSHTGSGNNGTIHSSGDWFIGKNSAQISGFFVQNAALLDIANAYASEIYQFVNVYTNVRITDTQTVSAVSSNTQIQVQVNDVTLTLNGLKISTKNDAHQITSGNKTGVVINCEDSIFYKDTPNASALDVFHSTVAVSPTFDRNTFGKAITFTFPYNFGGTGAVFAGDNNHYPSINRWAFNGSTYTSLATWKAAVATADAAADATGDASVAATLPTIPSVS